MSDSTTQPNKSTGASDATTSTFHRELQKKIRNKTKKIQQIQDAETKIKAEGKQPTPQHITKLASVPSLEADIAEVKGYLDLYNQSTADFEKKEAVVRKQHAKELGQARKAAVTTVVNMSSMFALQDCGQKIPESIEEGVAHFREIVGKLSLRTEQSGNWRVNRDLAISEWTRLSSASQDTIEHTEISYEDLVSGVIEAVSSGGYPEEISKPKKEKKAKKSEPKQAEPEVKAPVVEAPVEVAEPEPVAVEEPVVAEPVAVEAPEEPATEEPTLAVEEPVAAESEAVAETKPVEEEKSLGGERESNPRTRGDRIERRGRGERGDRGDRRGRGRGDRGDRGDRRGRGRGTYVKRPYGEDAEGFITVKEDNEPAYRGRGRGRGTYRGSRGGERGGDRGGERGGYRGDRGGYRGDRGDRGNYRGSAERGDRRGRGERPQRKGQEFAEGKQINEKVEGQQINEKVEAAPAE